MWPAIWTGIKGLGAALLGGIGSGLARRAETQIGGPKAGADYAGSGGQSGIAAQQSYTYGTQQASSQGQAEAFQQAQNRSQTQAYSSEADKSRTFAAGQSEAQRKHERQQLLTEMYLGRNMSAQGDTSNGQVPLFNDLNRGLTSTGRYLGIPQQNPRQYGQPLPPWQYGND